MKQKLTKKEKALKRVNNRKFALFKFFNWRNISIGRKYITSFSIAAILFFISALIVYFQLSVVEEDISKFEEYSLRTNDTAELASLMQNKDVYIADYIISGS